MSHPEAGTFPEKPFVVVMPKDVVTLSGTPKTGFTQECTSTSPASKGRKQCCSFKMGVRGKMHNSLMSKDFDSQSPLSTYREAQAECEKEGSRLCTLKEFEGGTVQMLDPNHKVWTSDSCTYVPGDEIDKNVEVLQTLAATVAKLEKKADGIENELKFIWEKREAAQSHEDLPFTMDNLTHDVILKDYNLVVKSSARTPGTGNLVVGLGHHFNKASNSVILGEDNEVTGDSDSVGGGVYNQAMGTYTSVLGGSDNKAVKKFATVLGGKENTAQGKASAVGGGEGNMATGIGSAVAGGYENTASGKDAVVGGGDSNDAQAEASTVNNGYLNQVLGAGSGVHDGFNRINKATTLIVQKKGEAHKAPSPPHGKSKPPGKVQIMPSHGVQIMPSGHH